MKWPVVLTSVTVLGGLTQHFEFLLDVILYYGLLFKIHLVILSVFYVSFSTFRLPLCLFPLCHPLCVSVYVCESLCLVSVMIQLCGRQDVGTKRQTLR